MAADTLTAQAGSPCASAPIEQLDEMLRQICLGENVDLKRFVRRMDSDDIRWEAVRHLQIVGIAIWRYRYNLNIAGLSDGFYSNADGSWLLIVTDSHQPADYVKRCGTDLESLRINVTVVSAIPGLEHLTRLTSLNLSECMFLTRLRDWRI